MKLLNWFRRNQSASPKIQVFGGSSRRPDVDSMGRRLSPDAIAMDALIIEWEQGDRMKRVAQDTMSRDLYEAQEQAVLKKIYTLCDVRGPMLMQELSLDAVTFLASGIYPTLKEPIQKGKCE
jgi:hypothetical protein